MGMDELQASIIRIAAEAGAKAGIEAYNRQLHHAQSERVDRRLRNTKLLLRNYRMFKEHCENAVYKAEVAEDEDFFDVVDTMESYGSSTLYVESIKKSVARTVTIVKHIDVMLQLYDIYCAQSKNPEEERRNKVIHGLYIDENRMTIRDLADYLCVTDRTIYRDIDIACERIAALIFGIDGMKKT